MKTILTFAFLIVLVGCNYEDKSSPNYKEHCVVVASVYGAKDTVYYMSSEDELCIGSDKNLRPCGVSNKIIASNVFTYKQIY